MNDMKTEPTSSGPRVGALGARGCVRLRIAGLFDVVLTSDPEQIRWLNQHPDVTRPLDPGASLLHRIVHGRLARDLEFDHSLLPVFVSRTDAERAARQAALTERLDEAGACPGPQRDEIARHIAGAASGDLGVAVQEWCGRLFSDDYRATPDSYEAGHLIAEWPAAPPWKSIPARLSGRLARAKATLLAAAGGDLHAVHATSIGMENIVRTVRELARLARLPELDTASANRALARCLRVPPVILRGCQGEVAAPFLSRPLTPRTLIVFLLARAHARSGDLDIAFLSGSWSGCPARQVVPEMLREAWYTARQDGAGEKDWSERVKPWGRVLLRAVSAFEGRAS
jgi:hypothetical protein